LETLHVEVDHFSTFLLPPLNVGVLLVVAKRRVISERVGLLDCASDRIIEVKVVQLRVSAVQNETESSEVIVVNDDGECLPDVATSALDFRLERI